MTDTTRITITIEQGVYSEGDEYYETVASQRMPLVKVKAPAALRALLAELIDLATKRDTRETAPLAPVDGCG